MGLDTAADAGAGAGTGVAAVVLTGADLGLGTDSWGSDCDSRSWDISLAEGAYILSRSRASRILSSVLLLLSEILALAEEWTAVAGGSVFAVLACTLDVVPDLIPGGTALVT